MEGLKTNHVNQQESECLSHEVLWVRYGVEESRISSEYLPQFFKAPIWEYYFCDIVWKKDMMAKRVKRQQYLKEVPPQNKCKCHFRAAVVDQGWQRWPWGCAMRTAREWWEDWIQVFSRFINSRHHFPTGVVRGLDPGIFSNFKFSSPFSNWIA